MIGPIEDSSGAAARILSKIGRDGRIREEEFGTARGSSGTEENALERAGNALSSPANPPPKAIAEGAPPPHGMDYILQAYQSQIDMEV